MRELTRVYQLGAEEIHALRGIDMVVGQGEYVAIMGPSGSGKSTLMNIIGCLDRPTAGQYILDGTPVESMNDDELAAVRNKKIGFVFQTFNLLARTTALVVVLQNIASLKVFDQMYIMTSGGPNFSTRSALEYIYDVGFTSFRTGYAAAVSTIFFILVLAVSAVWVALTRRQEQGL